MKFHVRDKFSCAFKFCLLYLSEGTTMREQNFGWSFFLVSCFFFLSRKCSLGINKVCVIIM